MNVELAAKAVKDLLIKKAIGDTLPMDMNDLSEYKLEEAIRKSQEVEEKSDEVTRQIQIMRINACVRKTRGGIKLEDYNLSLHIGERKVSIVQENYVFVEDSLGDDDIDFEDMDNDAIDELHEIIDQVEIIDEKTMRRTEN